MNTLIFGQMLKQRRRSIVWWSAAVAVFAWVIAASYPSVAESAGAFNEYVKTLPDGVVDLFGSSSLTSPDGYLTSQFYGNMFPLLLVILGIGAAAWSIAGSETEGTLEMLLANPVSRTTVAVSRFLATSAIVLIVATVATAVMIALRGLYQLESIAVADIAAAGLGAYLVAVVFASVAFATGAAFGSRPASIAAGAGVAAGTYVLFALSGFVSALSSVKWASPWYWFLEANPLGGVTASFWWAAFALPIVVTLTLVVIGLARFRSRDIG